MEEEQPLLPLVARSSGQYKHKELNKFSRTIAIIGGIVVIITALLALSSTMTSRSFSSHPLVLAFKTNEQKLMLAKSGEIKYTSLSTSLVYTLFVEYKSTYNKEYTTKSEESKKQKNFQAFLSTIDSRNAAEKEAGSSAVHGITIFSDMSEEEFRDMYLSSYVKSDITAKKAVVKATYGDSTSSTTISWVGVYTGAVNNQGYCGSCWAFTTAEQIQADAVRAKVLSIDDPLSVQQILNCDVASNGYKTDDQGCGGGDPLTALQYIKTTGGLCLDKSYPYTATTGLEFGGDLENEVYGAIYGKVDVKTDIDAACTALKKNYVVTVDEYYQISNEDDMIEYVKKTGPLAVCVDASLWATYQSGVLSNCGDSLNHCVQVVGYNSKENYYLVRNSWGENWGMEGYIKVQAGSNTCGIAEEAIYTDVSKVKSEVEDGPVVPEPVKPSDVTIDPNAPVSGDDKKPVKPAGDDVKPDSKPAKPDTPVESPAEDGDNTKPVGDDPNVKPVKPEELDNKPSSNKQPEDKSPAADESEESQDSTKKPAASGSSKVKPGSPDQVKPATAAAAAADADVVTSTRKNKN